MNGGIDTPARVVALTHAHNDPMPPTPPAANTLFGIGMLILAAVYFGTPRAITFPKPVRLELVPNTFRAHPMEA